MEEKSMSNVLTGEIFEAVNADTKQRGVGGFFLFVLSTGTCHDWTILCVPPWHNVSVLLWSRECTEKTSTERQKGEGEDMRGQRTERSCSHAAGWNADDQGKLSTDWQFPLREQLGREVPSSQGISCEKQGFYSSNTCPLEQMTLGTYKIKEKEVGIKGDYYNS